MSGNAPWFLPVGCYSLIVMREAVVRSYPAGPLAFEYAFRPIRKNSLHYLVLAFTQAEAQAKLDQLAEMGLNAGEDVAGADDLGKPVFSCPGVAFRNLSKTGGNRWRVDDPWAVPLPSEVEDTPQGPVVVDQAGCRVASLEVPGAGLVVGSRTRLDVEKNNLEYLCVFSGPWGFTIDVCRYAWLGDVPRDWFDANGLLHADHLDQYGFLKLPEEIDGHRVLGHLDGGFVGAFQSITGGPGIQISDGSRGMVEAALQVLGWNADWVEDVQRAMWRLMEAEGDLPEALQQPQVTVGGWGSA